MTLTRRMLQELSWQRLREAKTLLEARHWSGSYDLSGYSVECALKACIARQRGRHEFPPPPGEAARVYSHNLEDLRSLAGLQFSKSDVLRIANWYTVQDWNVRSRYRSDIEESMARDLMSAITGRKGVLAWVRKSW
jgi:HEPN domain-containing protein